MSDKPKDECVCSHLRDDHSGKGDKKRCTAKVFGMGRCDCDEYRFKAAIRPREGEQNGK